MRFRNKKNNVPHAINPKFTIKALFAVPYITYILFRRYVCKRVRQVNVACLNIGSVNIIKGYIIWSMNSLLALL